MNLNRNRRGMEQRVVNQALMHGAIDPFEMLGIQPGGYIDEDAEVVQTRRAVLQALLGGDADFGSGFGELVFAQVSSGIERSARTEGREHEFGRSHAFVEAAVFGWLVGCYDVLTGSDFKLNGAEMFN
jgi:hypothetical protein